MIIGLIKRTAVLEVRVGPRGRPGEAGASAWADITGKPSTFPPSSHTHAIADTTGLQTALDAKASTSHTHGQSDITGLSASLASKADLVDGVIPTAQIPAIAITDFLGSVADEAAMLALTGQKGDWCNRSDTSTAWVIVGNNTALIASWAQIEYPASPVMSVNGQTGVVVLGKSDIGLGSVANALQLVAANNLSDLTNAATARTNLGLVTSTGGNGEADSGKVPLMTSLGGLSLGNTSVFDDTILKIQTGIGYGISVKNAMFGTGVYSELDGSGSQAFHAHITALATGENVGFDGDMTGGTGVNYLSRGIVRSNGYLLYGQEIVSTQQQDRFTINAQGGLTWFANGTTLTTGSNKTSLVVATPSGNNTITLPATPGTLITTGDTGTVSNAMLANSVITINGAAVSLGGSITTAVLGANTFTGAQTLPAGTVSAPAINFGSAGTGWYASAANLIDGSINGTRRFALSADKLVITGAEASGRVLDLTSVNGTAYFTVTGGGALFINGAAYFTGGEVRGAQSGNSANYCGMLYDSGSALAVIRPSTSTLQIGAGAASPIAYTVRGASARSGTDSNVAGASLTLAGGNGTGTGGGGALVFQTAPVGSSGSAANTLTTRMTIKRDGVINFSSLPTSAAGLSTGDLWNDAGILKVA